MNMARPRTNSAFGSRWVVWIGLTMAAILIAPTFVLGFLSTTFTAFILCASMAVAYGYSFLIIFQSQTPLGIREVTSAYHDLSLWMTVIGTITPFLAGYIFRAAWSRSDPKFAVVLTVASFSVLALGAMAVSDKTDALIQASGAAVGRSQALAELNEEADNLWIERRGAPEAWAARYIASRVSGELLGINTPPSLEDFVQRTKGTGSAE